MQQYLVRTNSRALILKRYQDTCVHAYKYKSPNDWLHYMHPDFYLLGKEVMFSVALVCLSVSNITQNVNRLQQNFMEGSKVVKGIIC